jgi:hypothetical protein
MRSIEESYPAEFRGGLAYSFFDGRGLLSAELDHRSGPGVSLHGGSEFWVHRTLALRLGYAGSEPGGGVSVRVSPDLRFDYAAVDHELGVTHCVALAYRFGGFFASSQAVPEVFSPLGQQSVTKFNLKARTKVDASSWSLDIVDKSNQIVRRFSGKGVPPAHVMWRGFRFPTACTLTSSSSRTGRAAVSRDTPGKSRSRRRDLRAPSPSSPAD